ncbi:hypothetical protein VNO80_20053 [Phaseolus coccineus]|uniref:DEAD/DEAH-box helicase domain-containing protein n=1 Tax=Phaseolus coccineus TaxID=3886 RepID=A0AAN9R5G3_PHACN
MRLKTKPNCITWLHFNIMQCLKNPRTALHRAISETLISKVEIEMQKKSTLPLSDANANRKKKELRSRETLVKLLRWHFGYPDFRGMQLDAIQSVLSGKDCFCLMPTGGGKSMCYQIPALAKTGIVLVVCPLIGGCRSSFVHIVSLAELVALGNSHNFLC